MPSVTARAPSLLPPVTAGCRGLSDRVRAIRGLLGLEGELDPARLEVVEARIEVVAKEAEVVQVVEVVIVVVVARANLHERGAVVEVTGVAELNRWRTLEGVVARVGDPKVVLDVPTLRFLIQTGV